ncbi:hypothetical protein TWF481_002800 [Arthrobotrys musiformis]|uniref:Myb-like domain-containing protein n=1 Tax=Arthrobotrys musiformis TaxID=47236 RepID=A0AAV9VT00_9PEZI
MNHSDFTYNCYSGSHQNNLPEDGLTNWLYDNNLFAKSDTVYRIEPNMSQFNGGLGARHHHRVACSPQYPAAVYPEVMTLVAAEYPRLFPENAFLQNRRENGFTWKNIIAELEGIGCSKIEERCLQMRWKRNTPWFGLTQDEIVRRQNQAKKGSETRRYRRITQKELVERSKREPIQIAPAKSWPEAEGFSIGSRTFDESKGPIIEPIVGWGIGRPVDRNPPHLGMGSRIRCRYKTNLYKLKP